MGQIGSVPVTEYKWLLLLGFPTLFIISHGLSNDVVCRENNPSTMSNSTKSPTKDSGWNPVSFANDIGLFAPGHSVPSQSGPEICDIPFIYCNLVQSRRLGRWLFECETHLLITSSNSLLHCLLLLAPGFQELG